MKLQLAILSILAAVSVAVAQTPALPELPPPTVAINTNTIVKIIAVWDKADSPAGTFAKIADLMKFNGVYCWQPNKGGSSGGMAALASLVTVQWDACQFDFGPAYVVGMDNQDGFFQAIEAGMATKFLGAKIQERMQEAFGSVPVLDLVPRYLDVSGFSAFIGAGATLGGANQWQPVGAIVSAGGGGIKWGK